MDYAGVYKGQCATFMFEPSLCQQEDDSRTLIHQDSEIADRALRIPHCAAYQTAGYSWFPDFCTFVWWREFVDLYLVVSFIWFCLFIHHYRAEVIFICSQGTGELWNGPNPLISLNYIIFRVNKLKGICGWCAKGLVCVCWEVSKGWVEAFAISSFGLPIDVPLGGRQITKGWAIQHITIYDVEITYEMKHIMYFNLRKERFTTRLRTVELNH